MLVYITLHFLSRGYGLFNCFYGLSHVDIAPFFWWSHLALVDEVMIVKTISQPSALAPPTSTAFIRAISSE
jgi:hypothetical protein